MTRRALALLALCSMAPQLRAQELSLETIVVKNRPAEDLVAVVRPLIGVDGSVTAFGSRLIVKAQPRALREIKDLVARLDVAPRSLMITVRQSRDVDTSGRSAGGNVVVERREGQRGTTRTTTRVTGAFGQGSTSERGQDVQQLRALEGHPSLIRLGKEVPTPVPGGTVYAEAESGFYVTASLAGDLVTLEITTMGDRVDDAGRIERQQLRSTVSGRLGEWIALGSLESSESASERGILSRSSARGLDLRSVSLKVDEVR
jgi:hypothetical protein